MAYNSDGYIMIDFTEVDFRRTNQTIEGLYKRCVDVIGTNKFILVINANGRTPLPATCSFTNNQYVIDTVIYMFAVSSNDNLFIRRNDVPASDIIDDSSISVDKTWSSNKIDTELDGKADTSALADYQPLLTAVSPVSINADNEISVDLSGKQDTLTPVSPVSINADNEISVDLSGKQNVLTAGDNISIANDVINVLGNTIKYYDYVGNDTSTDPSIHTLILPEKFTAILSITGKGNTEYSLHDVIYNGYTLNFITYNFYPPASVIRTIGTITGYTDNSITFQSTSAPNVFNYNNITYRVLYI